MEMNKGKNMSIYQPSLYQVSQAEFLHSHDGLACGFEGFTG